MARRRRNSGTATDPGTHPLLRVARPQTGAPQHQTEAAALLAAAVGPTGHRRQTAAEGRQRRARKQRQDGRAAAASRSPSAAASRRSPAESWGGGSEMRSELCVRVIRVFPDRIPPARPDLAGGVRFGRKGVPGSERRGGAPAATRATRGRSRRGAAAGCGGGGDASEG